MLIRYKHWSVDGVPAHKAVRGGTEYVFLDSEQGICDVRDRVGIEYLLARPVNYELAFEVYGIAFGPDGKQLDAPTPIVSTSGEVGTNSEPEDREPIIVTLEKRRVGRPRKVRS